MSYGIPDLQFHLRSIDGHSPASKLHSDGQVVDGLETTIRELQKQARLANGSVAHNDILEQELVRKRRIGWGGCLLRLSTTTHLLAFVFFP